jgi:iron complex transport system ATP-binding protein
MPMRDLIHPQTVPLLQTISLSVRTPDRAARALLTDLNWQVETGQCWCVIGRNGAGKSSLLRSLVGARPVDAGSVQMNGKPLASYRLDDLAQLRAYLPQARTDAFAYSVLETVLSTRFPYADVHYWDNDDQIAHARYALQQLDVAELAQRDIRSLSGGERQRVAIAATIAQETPLLLLDEPSGALDLAHQVSVMQLLGTLYRQQNKAIIMVSHDLNLSHQLASHALLLMGDGRYLAGAKEQVMTSEHLSVCLGQSIERIQHQDRVLFLPLE